jgi:competence protein ComEA
MRAWLEQNQFLVLAFAAVLFLGSLAVISLGGSDPPAFEFEYGSGLEPGTPIKVHVTGAVARPGVYELREGDRVEAALAAAGGTTEAADLEALNLARRVRDEEQLLVPVRTGRSTPVATLAPGARLDINTATTAELDQLPGIGEAYSRRIVDSRRADGPYRSVDDLVQRRVLPQATLEQVRHLIAVGP